MQILQVFLPLKEPLVASLNETCALTSETNVAKKGMTIPNLSNTIRLFCPNSKRMSVTKGISIFLINLKPLYLAQPYPYTLLNHILAGNESTTFTKVSHRKFFYR